MSEVEKIRYYSATTKLSGNEINRLKLRARRKGVTTSEFLRQLLNQSENPLSLDVRLEIMAASVDALRSLVQYLLLEIVEKEEITSVEVRQELREVETCRLQRVNRAIGEDGLGLDSDEFHGEGTIQ